MSSRVLRSQKTDSKKRPAPEQDEAPASPESYALMTPLDKRRSGVRKPLVPSAENQLSVLLAPKSPSEMAKAKQAARVKAFSLMPVYTGSSHHGLGSSADNAISLDEDEEEEEEEESNLSLYLPGKVLVTARSQFSARKETRSIRKGAILDGEAKSNLKVSKPDGDDFYDHEEIPDSDCEYENLDEESSDEEYDEDLEEDDMGDSEVINGPDYNLDEEAVERSTEVIPPQSVPIVPSMMDMDFEIPAGLRDDQTTKFDRFGERLRYLIIGHMELLKHDGQWQIWTFTEKQRPMSHGFMKLFSRASIDFLMNLYRKAIVLQAQIILGQESWKLLDFLALPETATTSQGCYGAFPTGPGIENTEGAEHYIGSATGVGGNFDRMRQHVRTAGKSVDELSKYLENSALYRCLCRPGVEPNLRVLAEFDDTVPTGYVLTLEGLLHTGTGAYQDLGRVSIWAPESTHNAVAKVRAGFNMGNPFTGFGGLNRAWALYQGFRHSKRNTSQHCFNTECSRSLSGISKYLVDITNPLGALRCRDCHKWFQRNDKERTPKVGRSGRLFHEVQAESKKYRASKLCKPGDSSFECENPGCEATVRLSYVSDLKELHCGSCYDFWVRNGTRRTVFRSNAALNLARAALNGAYAVCYSPSCGASESSSEIKDHFIFRQETADFICDKCYSFEKRNGVPRFSVPGSVEISIAARAALNGAPAICSNVYCGAVESVPRKKNTSHRYDSVAKSFFCRVCESYKSKTGKPRSADLCRGFTNSHRSALNGAPAVCVNPYCGTVEPQLSKKSPVHIYYDAFNGYLCPADCTYYKKNNVLRSAELCQKLKDKLARQNAQ